MPDFKEDSYIVLKNKGYKGTPEQYSEDLANPDKQKSIYTVLNNAGYKGTFDQFKASATPVAPKGVQAEGVGDSESTSANGASPETTEEKTATVTKEVTGPEGESVEVKKELEIPETSDAYANLPDEEKVKYLEMASKALLEKDPEGSFDEAQMQQKADYLLRKEMDTKAFEESSTGYEGWQKFKGYTSQLASGAVSIPNKIGAFIRNSTLSKEEKESFAKLPPEVQKVLSESNPGDMYSAFALTAEKELEEYAEEQLAKSTQYNTTIMEDLRNGDYYKAGNRVGAEAMGQVGNILAAMVPGGVYALGASAASNKVDDLVEKGEGYSGTTALNAAVSGVIETASEMITARIGGKLLKSLKGQDIGGARQMISGYLNSLAVDPVLEGLGESSVELVNILADAYISGDEDAWNGAFDRIAEAGIIGAFTGKVMGTATNTARFVNVASDYNVAKSLVETSPYESMADMFSSKDMGNGNYSVVTIGSSRAILETELKIKTLKGEMTKEQAQEVMHNYNKQFQAAESVQTVPDANKEDASQLVLEKNQIEQDIKNQDPATTVKAKARIEEINTELNELSKEEAVEETAPESPTKEGAPKTEKSPEEMTAEDVDSEFFSEIDNEDKIEEPKKAAYKGIGKAVARAASALKKTPFMRGTNIVMVDPSNMEDMKKLPGAKLQEGLKGNKGFYHYDENTGEGTIYINAQKADASTVAHEVLHAVLDKGLGGEANVAKSVRKLAKELEKAGVDKEILAKAKDYAKNYNEGDYKGARAEETLAQFVGELSKAYSNKSIPQKGMQAIQEFVVEILEKAGMQKFAAKVKGASPNEMAQLLTDLEAAVRRGKEIKSDIPSKTKEIAGKKSKNNGPGMARKGAVKKQKAYRSGDNTDVAEGFDKMIKGSTERGTGHFGTGAYYFGDKNTADKYDARPTSELELDGLNMAKASKKLHDGLKKVNHEVQKNYKPGKPLENLTSLGRVLNMFGIERPAVPAWARNAKALEAEAKRTGKTESQLLDEADKIQEQYDAKVKGAMEAVNAAEANGVSPSTALMQYLGFDGVDATGTDMDNSQYGTVVYPKAKGAIKKQKLSRKEYETKLKETKASDPKTYWSVDEIDSSYEGKVVQTDKGAAFVKTDGDIVGVFKFPEVTERRVIDEVLSKAAEQGGTKLDNFDNYLSKIYKRNGFRTVSRVPFSEEHAPDGWNKKDHGTPDVVAMVYDPKGEMDIQEKKFDDYEQAMAYRDAVLEGKSNIIPDVGVMNQTMKPKTGTIKFQKDFDKLKRLPKSKNAKIADVKSAKELDGQVVSGTMSDRLAAGNLRGKRLLGGILYPWVTGKVWAFDSKSHARAFVDAIETSADGYKYWIPITMGEVSHLSNKDMFDSSLGEMLEAVASGKSYKTKKEVNDRFDKTFFKLTKASSKDTKARVKEVKTIYDREVKKAKDALGVAAAMVIALEETSDTFDKRKDAVKKLLGGTKRTAFKGMENYVDWASKNAEPELEGLAEGEVKFIYRTKGEISWNKLNKGQEGYHSSYQYVAESSDVVEMIPLENEVWIGDLIPEFQNKGGGTINAEKYRQDVREKNKSAKRPRSERQITSSLTREYKNSSYSASMDMTGLEIKDGATLKFQKMTPKELRAESKSLDTGVTKRGSDLAVEANRQWVTAQTALAMKWADTLLDPSNRTEDRYGRVSVNSLGLHDIGFMTYEEVLESIRGFGVDYATRLDRMSKSQKKDYVYNLEGLRKVITPEIYYRGTNKVSDQFDNERSGRFGKPNDVWQGQSNWGEKGYFFSTRKEVAERYSRGDGSVNEYVIKAPKKTAVVEWNAPWNKSPRVRAWAKDSPAISKKFHYKMGEALSIQEASGVIFKGGADAMYLNGIDEITTEGYGAEGATLVLPFNTAADTAKQVSFEGETIKFQKQGSGKTHVDQENARAEKIINAAAIALDAGVKPTVLRRAIENRGMIDGSPYSRGWIDNMMAEAKKRAGRLRVKTPKGGKTPIYTKDTSKTTQRAKTEKEKAKRKKDQEDAKGIREAVKKILNKENTSTDDIVISRFKLLKQKYADMRKGGNLATKAKADFAKIVNEMMKEVDQKQVTKGEQARIRRLVARFNDGDTKASLEIIEAIQAKAKARSKKALARKARAAVKKKAKKLGHQKYAAISEIMRTPFRKVPEDLFDTYADLMIRLAKNETVDVVDLQKLERDLRPALKQHLAEESTKHKKELDAFDALEAEMQAEIAKDAAKQRMANIKDGITQQDAEILHEFLRIPTEFLASLGKGSLSGIFRGLVNAIGTDQVSTREIARAVSKYRGHKAAESVGKKIDGKVGMKFVNGLLKGDLTAKKLADVIRKSMLHHIDGVVKGIKGTPLYDNIIHPLTSALHIADDRGRNIGKKVGEAHRKAMSNTSGIGRGNAFRLNVALQMYLRQREFEMNPGNPKVFSMQEHMEAMTGKESLYGVEDLKFIQDIYNEYANSDGTLDSKNIENDMAREDLNLIQEMDEVLGDQRDQSVFVNDVIRGESLLYPSAGYFPRRGFNSSTLEEGNPINESTGNISVKAASSNERTASKAMPLDFNTLKSFQVTAEANAQEYALAAVVRDTSNAIKAMQESSDPNVVLLGDTLKLVTDELLKNQLNSVAGKKTTAARIWSLAVRRVYQNVLVTVSRIGKDAGASWLSFGSAYVDKVPKIAESRKRLDEEFMAALEDEFSTTQSGRIGNRSADFHASEISSFDMEKFKTSKRSVGEIVLDIMSKNRMSDAADIASVWYYKAVDPAHLIWKYEFDSAYEKIAGEKIDPEKFKKDGMYRVENSQSIKQAILAADKQTANIFNTGAKAEQKLMLQAQNKSILASVTYMFRSFAANEQATFLKTIRTLTGSKEMSMENAIRTGYLIAARGFLYTYLGSVVGPMVQAMLSGDDWEEEALNEDAAKKAVANFAVLGLTGNKSMLEQVAAEWVIELANKAYMNSKGEEATPLFYARRRFAADTQTIKGLGAQGAAAGTAMDFAYDAGDAITSAVQGEEVDWESLKMDESFAELVSIFTGLSLGRTYRAAKKNIDAYTEGQEEPIKSSSSVRLK